MPCHAMPASERGLDLKGRNPISSLSQHMLASIFLSQEMESKKIVNWLIDILFCFIVM